ncbi:hypothetical protein [Nannocystis pusilla]|uniref:hypothetical protein n=1 Tax=Nannocystis pusilla TaxID=889268 RepID=UPI003B7BDF50
MRVSEGDQFREVIRRPEQILALKVCDPAMGSGSFVIAALRVLVDALYESLHEHGRLVDRPKETIARLADGLPLDHPSQETIPVPRDAPDFEDRLRARLKRHVVERCLYGVELDPSPSSSPAWPCGSRRWTISFRSSSSTTNCAAATAWSAPGSTASSTSPRSASSGPPATRTTTASTSRKPRVPAPSSSTATTASSPSCAARSWPAPDASSSRSARSPTSSTRTRRP